MLNVPKRVATRTIKINVQVHWRAGNWFKAYQRISVAVFILIIYDTTSLPFWLRGAVNCWGWGFFKLQTSVQKREVTIDFCFVVVVICDTGCCLIVIMALLEESEFSLSPKQKHILHAHVWRLHVNKLCVYRIIHCVSCNSLQTLFCVHKTLDWFTWQALHFVSLGGLFVATVLAQKEMPDNRLDLFQLWKSRWMLLIAFHS